MVTPIVGGNLKWTKLGAPDMSGHGALMLDQNSQAEELEALFSSGLSVPLGQTNISFLFQI